MTRKVRKVNEASRFSMKPATLAALCTLLAAPAAHAAMNFCAAPAMQASERIQADPGVKALVQ